MNLRFCIRPVLVSFLIGVGCTHLGCARKSAKTTPAPTVPPAVGTPKESPAVVPPPAAPAVMLELSEPQANVVGVNVDGMNILTLEWKVKYRFTQGQPQPGSWYRCEATVPPGVAHVLVEGKDMKQEGVFEEKTILLKGPPKSVEFRASQAPGKGGPYRDISKSVSYTLAQ